jgi:PBP1b-binding outer membrane lipoprotein LpoB
MSNKIILYTITFLVAIFTLQCGTSVQRLQTSKVVDLSGRWNDTDARLVAEEMVQDFMQSSFRTRFVDTYQKLPVVIVGDILNKSHEHIDADPFIKSIERELINMQSIRIVANGAFRDKLRQERVENSISSINNRKYGLELGADFMLLGTINTIVDTKAEGKRNIVFYQIDLNLVDLHTNETVWIGQKKIKKFVKK